MCLFHKGCPDGMTAAYPFWKLNKEKEGFLLEGVVYGNYFPLEDVKDKNIAIVDFSYDRKFLLEMAKVCKSILILDHHKTAEKDLERINTEAENIYCIFDMKRSGAQISWDYCFPDIIRPWFVDYVADRDLWKWELPFSKEVSEAMYFDNWFNFEKLDELYREKTGISQFVKTGELLLAIKQKKIGQVICRAVKCKFEGYNISLISCDRSIRSEVGNILANQEGIDFAVIWTYSFENDEWWISLRKSKDPSAEKINMLGIAEKYGGGGHPNACGFSFKGSLHDHFKRE